MCSRRVSDMPRAPDGLCRFETPLTLTARKAVTLGGATGGSLTGPKKIVMKSHANWGHASALVANGLIWRGTIRIRSPALMTCSRRVRPSRRRHMLRRQFSWATMRNCRWLPSSWAFFPSTSYKPPFAIRVGVCVLNDESDRYFRVSERLVVVNV